MKEAEHEKYLGDIIHKSGNINQTIDKRKHRAPKNTTNQTRSQKKQTRTG